MKKNRFVARDDRDAENQLKALYGKKPVRAGSNGTHKYWYVGKRRASMNLRATHRDGQNRPMHIIEVE